MINNELKWIINMNGDPGVLNISALLAKNGAIPLSPQTPISITSAPNIIIGLAGIAARFEVIKFFHIAQASECTDPNHSAKDGAIITSAHATKILKSSLENHLKI